MQARDNNQESAGHIFLLFGYIFLQNEVDARQRAEMTEAEMWIQSQWVQLSPRPVRHLHFQSQPMLHCVGHLGLAVRVV